MSGELYPRHRIDIEPAAMVRALAACASPSREAEAMLERFVDPAGEVLATLSARSGFDALLTALAFPAGSEVLLSAWTIPDMARVVTAHGLVPVPLDCDAGTLAPTVEALAAAITPATRAVVLAQLFGARVDLRPYREVCDARGVLLLDDDAQGFTGMPRLREGTVGHASLHSFGSIKTATALGGGLLRVRDAALRDRVREVMRGWPTQPSARYARKVASFLGLAGLRGPARYGAFARGVERNGSSLDAVITAAVKGFPAATPEALVHAIRTRPCAALCATLHAALAGFDEARIARRRDAGERTLRALAGVSVLGASMPDRTHWLFAVRVPDPDALVRTLRREGVDAARGTSTITALSAPPSRPDAHPVNCSAWPSEMVFLPAYPEVPEALRDHMADLVRAHAARGSTPAV
ncbi:MAG: DegT/DnrJ/EryC1/StrS family aminotransferase [Polyangiales bacterium]